MIEKILALKPEDVRAWLDTNPDLREGKIVTDFLADTLGVPRSRTGVIYQKSIGFYVKLPGRSGQPEDVWIRYVLPHWVLRWNQAIVDEGMEPREALDYVLKIPKGILPE